MGKGGGLHLLLPREEVGAPPGGMQEEGRVLLKSGPARVEFRMGMPAAWVAWKPLTETAAAAVRTAPVGAVRRRTELRALIVICAWTRYHVSNQRHCHVTTIGRLYGERGDLPSDVENSQKNEATSVGSL